MSLLTKTDLNPADHVLKYSLIYLGMRKITDEKIDKIKQPENMEPIKEFISKDCRYLYLFAI